MEKVAPIMLLTKRNVVKYYNVLNEKFLEQFGFYITDVSWDNIIKYLYSPKDSSSLAVTRILFGICMLLDISDERGGAVLPSRWGDPKICHFPLFPFLTALPLPYMALVYVALWIGALGIALGYRYRLSSHLFTVCYWYLFLIEKSYWNNHSYLFGLVALLLSCTGANCYWSIDAYFDPSLKRDTVPYWNYFIIKYQFFILYFMAGLKKGTAEWLTGYSVQNLGDHWVFTVFKLFLTVPQIDYIIVHWFIFVFDLTIAFWMMWSKTRHVAMVFCALFHLMNIRLFRIGMFPWVCLATMPLFYPFDWPKKIIQEFSSLFHKYHHFKCIVLKKSPIQSEECETETIKTGTKSDYKQEENIKEQNKITENQTKTNCDGDEQKPLEQRNLCTGKENINFRKNKTVFLIFLFVISQAFLPFSHFITQGYNNWTNGLYGYSWDMMVHTWEDVSVVVKVVDNTQNKEYFVDPYLFTPNDRWSRHGDMVYQYAHCLKEKLTSNALSNISIYVDVWSSLNGRFTQRMFDNKVDMLKTTWSPFKPIPYLMPLIEEGLSWRSKLQEIKEDVHSWNNRSDVLFIAEFPGYEQEKYIPDELVNATLSILKGTVLYETDEKQSHQLTGGVRVNLMSNKFHKITNIGSSPTFYMYTFANMSQTNFASEPKPMLPISDELSRRMKNMILFMKNVFNNLFELTRCQ